MTVILKKGQRLRDVLPEHDLSQKTKKLNASKYAGKIKFAETGIDIQERLRNEWN